jgi:membrane protease YdiL (CAAX protease family)
MTADRAARRRDAAVLALVVVVVTTWNVARTVAVADAAHVWINMAVAGIVTVLGIGLAHLTSSELGLGRDRLAAGLRWGGAAMGIVAVAIAVAAVLPVGDGLFDDDRAEIGLASMLVRATVVIPIGTVLVEELIFRGVLLGLARRLAPTTAAVALTSLLFGLWHVLPAWDASPDNAALEDVGRSGTVLGTFALTSVAGAVFAWLRIRSGSLLAPILAHIATNSIPFALAWLHQH